MTIDYILFSQYCHTFVLGFVATSNLERGCLALFPLRGNQALPTQGQDKRRQQLVH